jgi:predicted HD superfamily hydrolase involved in NAD metabolism
MPRDFIHDFQTSGRLNEDVIRFLSLSGFPQTAAHCGDVAAEAAALAERFDVDPVKAESAGYLHDISAVIPNDKRIEYAQKHDLEILIAEFSCPMILHQKLSVVLAGEVFEISDEAVLSAVGCHTTLKAGATVLDKVVFLADKIAWDQDDVPLYLSDVLEALEDSLDAAVLVYLDYLWEQRERLAVVHPWFVEAREDLLKLK